MNIADSQIYRGSNRTMRVVELTAPGILAENFEPIPEPQLDEVLLRTQAISVCSTDVSYFHGYLHPDHYPVILGHEYVGEVVAVGPDADPDLMGKRLSYFGQTDFKGMAEYRVLRPLFAGETKSSTFETSRDFKDDHYAAAVVIPDDVDRTAAPLLEPITAVLRAILKHPPKVGDNALVLGGGPCGAIAGTILKKVFATRTVGLLERNADRAAMAQSHYADVVYRDAEALGSGRDPGLRFDYIFDALPPIVGGAEDADPRRAAFKSATPEATYILYGASMEMQKFDTWLLLAKGINVKAGAFDVDYYPMSYTASVLRSALNLLQSKIIDPEWIMSRHIRFEDFDALAWTFQNHEKNPDLKTVITFDA